MKQAATVPTPNEYQVLKKSGNRSAHDDGMTDTDSYTTELKALRDRIDQLEAEAEAARDHVEQEEQRTSRRGMLRLAGAAAVGGLAAAVTADPVAATDGSAVLAAVSGNTATSPTGIAVTAALGAPYGLGCYEAGLGALPSEVGRPAVFGHATNLAFNTGVAGHTSTATGKGVMGVDASTGSSSGTGVWGQTQNGIAVYGVALASGGIGLTGLGVGGALRLLFFNPSPPTSRADSFEARTFEADDNNDVWYCYESGTPGKWRKLAGPGTAGAFHAITPTRVYDSRAPLPTPGILNTGQNRLVSVADGRDNNGTVTTPNLVPAGATAVAANITVTGTTGGFGYLAINPGGNTVEGASTINWSAAGLTIANGVTLTLNTTRQLTVICNGGGSTQFLIDISGYYL